MKFTQTAAVIILPQLARWPTYRRVDPNSGVYRFWRKNLTTHLKILATRRKTWTEFLTDAPQVLGATVRNSSPWRPGARDLYTSILADFFWNQNLYVNFSFSHFRQFVIISEWKFSSYSCDMNFNIVFQLKFPCKSIGLYSRDSYLELACRIYSL